MKYRVEYARDILLVISSLLAYVAGRRTSPTDE